MYSPIHDYLHNTPCDKHNRDKHSREPPSAMQLAPPVTFPSLDSVLRSCISAPAAQKQFDMSCNPPSLVNKAIKIPPTPHA
ncbi:hypothetical protein HZ326_23594 [Fusarium oxysporum f. sp. albedinis]|nr:hypothetical protein HZ326_23594 [Fusarium oxysporum f. sp. albedinis]